MLRKERGLRFGILSKHWRRLMQMSLELAAQLGSRFRISGSLTFSSTALNGGKSYHLLLVVWLVRDLLLAYLAVALQCLLSRLRPRLKNLDAKFTRRRLIILLSFFASRATSQN